MCEHSLRSLHLILILCSMRCEAITSSWLFLRVKWQVGSVAIKKCVKKKNVKKIPSHLAVSLAAEEFLIRSFLTFANSERSDSARTCVVDILSGSSTVFFTVIAESVARNGGRKSRFLVGARCDIAFARTSPCHLFFLPKREQWAERFVGESASHAA